MSQQTIASALATLRAEDARLAEHADAAAEWLGMAEGVERLSQYVLQRFLWYELPRKWVDATGEETELVADVREALARLLDRVGQERYAVTCRSTVTRQVHQAYLRSGDDGLSAFREAMEGSGIEPPDVDGYSWGTLMGIEEAMALGMVATALEEAVVSGELVVGARGWKAHQRKLTGAALERAYPGRSTASWREVILEERIERWRRDARSKRLATLRDGAAPQLQHAVALPDGVDTAFEPLRWFLTAIGDGVRLTAKGNLGRAFVVASAETRGWWPEYGGVRGEDDVIELSELHDLARTMRLVRRQHTMLCPTATGRRLAGDGERLWERFVSVLASRPDFPGVCLETSALLLLESVSARTYTGLLEDAAAMLGEEGYRSYPPGEPVSSYDVAWELAGVLRLFELFGMLSTSGESAMRRLVTTPSGDATLRSVLRARATGPSR